MVKIKVKVVKKNWHLVSVVFKLLANFNLNIFLNNLFHKILNNIHYDTVLH
jgi:hypothetical protein